MICPSKVSGAATNFTELIGSVGTSGVVRPVLPLERQTDVAPLRMVLPDRAVHRIEDDRPLSIDDDEAQFDARPFSAIDVGTETPRTQRLKHRPKCFGLHYPVVCVAFDERTGQQGADEDAGALGHDHPRPEPLLAGQHFGDCAIKRATDQ